MAKKASYSKIIKIIFKVCELSRNVHKHLISSFDFSGFH